MSRFTLATPSRWTPRLAARFARVRIDRIHNALLEIAGTYGDVDNTIVMECDDIVARLDDLTRAIDEALAEGRSL